MAYLLEESYRSNEWSVNNPRSLLMPFGSDLHTCPITEESYDVLQSTDVGTPDPLIGTLAPFDDSSRSVEDRDITINIDPEERIRGETVDNEYFLLESVVRDEKLLYPQTLKAQNYRIEDIAIYVHHSQNYFNPKHHPGSNISKKAYKILYHPIMYYVDWFISFFLLLLAGIEHPFYELLEPDESKLKIFAAVLESLIIAYFTFDLGLRFFWLGVKRYLRQKITLARLIGVILITIDFILALSIPWYYQHRFLRTCRPILFLTSHLNRNIRNVVNQLLNSIRRILDLYVLYLVFVVIFSLLAYNILGEIDVANYGTFPDSFITMFALSTTVNYPDVMLPALENCLLYFLLFFPFLSFGIYVLTNLLLAIVKDHFSRLEKEKLKQLLEFRRVSLLRAFHLGTQLSASEWDYSLFRRVMLSISKTISEKQCLLMFKVLDRHGNQKLSWKEFKQLSNVMSMRWRRSDLTNINKMWHRMIPIRLLRRVSEYTYVLVSSFIFKFIINLVILTNCALLIIETLVYNTPQHSDSESGFIYEGAFFLPIYFLEFCLQIVGFGPFYYFTHGWHVFDFIILFSSIIASGFGLTYITVLRTFRLLRVLKAKNSFRRIFTIISLSIPKLMRFVISICLAFYVYAILGMCLYAGKLRDCSFNELDLPEYNPDCGEEYDYQKNPPDGLYYLVNFNDILHSFITLFILMIVNNWQVVAKGYIAITGTYSYLFFIFFYLFVVLVITNVTAAFVLDLYDSISTTLGKSFTVRVSLSKKVLERFGIHENIEGDEVEYVGRRKLGQFDSLMLLYQSEDWVQEDEISPIGDFYIQH
ncbi:Two-pore channel 1 [Oopsacas minuta]|uniref:Two-pore channel 1 n=1 Tax=Oopsacas minuta TaxID=111878 RepID=A0AAV7K679_9METZ|nr:Two-pore channel 1 [Oopsacas minuta]